jgi:two-component system chemotaxis response regulator CheB
MKLLVVDDSALMRRSLRECFADEADIEVFTARDGQDALDQIRDLQPDVVTLDINMPVMDGLTCLSHIMTEMPLPVVMVSSLTEKGATITFEALELGAVDYVAKPGGTVSLNLKRVFPDIVAKVRAAARARHRVAGPLRDRLRADRARIAKAARPARSVTAGAAAADLVLVGVSTGGPRTLEAILEALPADFPVPVLIAQHMPGRFTGVFAERLNGGCAIQVSEVAGPTPLEPGQAYVARGDADVVVSVRGGRPTAVSVPADPELTWHPSVERMVASASRCLPAERLIAVQLTGMGDDGVGAMCQLKAAGGRTIAESADTAVIFGMPKELIDRGGAVRVLPCQAIAEQLCRWANANANARR